MTSEPNALIGILSAVMHRSTKTLNGLTALMTTTPLSWAIALMATHAADISIMPPNLLRLTPSSDGDVPTHKLALAFFWFIHTLGPHTGSTLEFLYIYMDNKNGIEVRHIARSIRVLSNQRELHLDTGSVPFHATSSIIFSLAESLESLTKLESVTLPSHLLFRSPIWSALSALPRLHNLACVEMGKTDIPRDIFAFEGPFIGVFHALESLEVDITLSAMRHLVNSKSFPSLTRLVLSVCETMFLDLSFDDVQGVLTLGQLEILHIRAPWSILFTDDDYGRLSRALPHLTALSVTTFQRRTPPTATLAALSQIAECNPNLVEVTIHALPRIEPYPFFNKAAPFFREIESIGVMFPDNTMTEMHTKAGHKIAACLARLIRFNPDTWLASGFESGEDGGHQQLPFPMPSNPFYEVEELVQQWDGIRSMVVSFLEIREQIGRDNLSFGRGSPNTVSERESESERHGFRMCGQDLSRTRAEELYRMIGWSYLAAESVRWSP